MIDSSQEVRAGAILSLVSYASIPRRILVYESAEQWRDVDDYFVETLVREDEPLRAARLSSAESTMPRAEVAPNQGALLALLTRLAGARRVLEIGTLTGYSTIWLARAAEHVTTLEFAPENAEIARRNFAAAGVADRIDLIAGPALESLAALTGPYEMVFIDADKPNNPAYLEHSLRLTRPGSVIVLDNVVRDGAVIDAASDDPRVIGARRFLEMVRDDPRLEATALQTVGSKGWDGFALAIVL
jgi:predicted O-methyltransferase YrrM